MPTLTYFRFRRFGVTMGNLYGRGSGQIWLDNVHCNGDEMSLAECGHNGWSVHSCGHYADVSIACGNSTCKWRQKLFCFSIGQKPVDCECFIVCFSRMASRLYISRTWRHCDRCRRNFISH